MIKKLGFAGLFGFIADLLTFFQFFTWLLELCGVDFTKAENINKWISIGGLVLIGLSFVLILLYTHIRQKEVGTHGIACDLIPFLRYKLLNRHHTMLSSLHRELYHRTEKVKEIILTIQKERYRNHRNQMPLAPLSINDIEEPMRNLMNAFHRALYQVFGIDSTISLYLISEANGETILKRSLLQRSVYEMKRNERRPTDNQYIIHRDNELGLREFATRAKRYNERNGNGQYKKNSYFDYVLSTSHNAYLSNDLKEDEQNDDFFSSSNHYLQFYESLGVFAIVPPEREQDREAAIKGLLTFDCHKTNRFSEEECTLMMGLMAHFVYDILESLKFVNYE